MVPLTINSTVKLPSGYEMPRLGFGVCISPPTRTSFKDVDRTDQLLSPFMQVYQT